MKLSLAALALAHLTTVFPASAQLPTGFDLQQIYYTDSVAGPISEISYADQLGGGFIVGDFLYLVAGSEASTGALFEVPLVRNEIHGKIQGMDFSNARSVFATEYLDNGFQTVGLGNHRWYSISDTSYYPEQIGYGTYDSNAKTFTEDGRITMADFEALNKIDPFSDESFVGFFGIDFSPVFEDPETGHGMMYGTAPYGFWRMGLTAAGTPTKYTPSNAEFLCSLDARYPGGFAYIPSGSYKDSVFLSDYSNGRISLLSLDENGLCIDATSGLGELGTNNPKIETFASEIDYPWGFFFDPVTNDFFATSWGADNEVYQFTGFPPGVSMSVLFANIAAAINDIQILLNPARRRLDGVRKIRNKTNKRTNNKSTTKVVNNEPISSTEEIAADPARRRGLDGVRGLGKKSTVTIKKSKTKKEEVVDEPIPTPEEIAEETAEALLNGDAETASEAILAPLNTIINNDSFTKDVIAANPEGSAAFVADVETVQDGFAAALDTPEVTEIINSLEEADKANFDSAREKLDELFALILSAVEVK